MEEIISTIKKYLEENAIEVILTIIAGIIILFVGFKLIKLLKKLMLKSKRLKKINHSAQSFIVGFVTVSLKTVLIVTVAAMMGVPMASMTALIGSVGLAIGLSLQGSLSNFAGGLVILISKPFVLNDFIITKDYEGYVTDISLLYTTLRTRFGENVIIPNSTISNEQVVNASRTPYRRIDTQFTVAYGTNPDKVIEILTNVAKENPDVVDEPVPFAEFINHADSALVFVLHAWGKNDDYWTLGNRLRLETNEAFEKNGIKVPFPQLDIHMDK